GIGVRRTGPGAPRRPDCTVKHGDPERVPNPPRDGLRWAKPSSVHTSVRRPPSILCSICLLFLCARISSAAEPDARAARKVDLVIGAAANDMQLLEPPIREMLAAKGLDVAATRKRTVTTEDVAAAIAPPQEATATATPTMARVLLDFTVA